MRQPVILVVLWNASQEAEIIAATQLASSAFAFSLEPLAMGLCCPYLTQAVLASSLGIPSQTHPEAFPWRPVVSLTVKFNHHTLFTHTPLLVVLSALSHFAPHGHAAGQGWITRDNSQVACVPLDREKLPSSSHCPHLPTLHHLSIPQGTYLIFCPFPPIPY